MLNKKIQQSNLVVLNLRHSLRDLIRDQIRAPRLGLKSKLLLRPHRVAGFCSAYRCRRGAVEEGDQAERCRPDVVEETGEKGYEEDKADEDGG